MPRSSCASSCRTGATILRGTRRQNPTRLERASAVSMSSALGSHCCQAAVSSVWLSSSRPCAAGAGFVLG
eukprot:12898595-Prorocentrum_lima.AAC.1